MRRVIDPQLQFGEQDLSAIELDPKSRDDIPEILCGLQYLYTTRELRERVFAILSEVLPERVGEGVAGKADPNQGRPGMEQWKILVLGVLRLGLNADYDRIHELANQHATASARCSGTAAGTMRAVTTCRRSRTTCACSPPSSWIGSIRKWFARAIGW
jgi:hypothetical protein